jgi:hypothetical protein
MSANMLFAQVHLKSSGIPFPDLCLMVEHGFMLVDAFTSFNQTREKE